MGRGNNSPRLSGLRLAWNREASWKIFDIDRYHASDNFSSTDSTENLHLALCFALIFFISDGDSDKITGTSDKWLQTVDVLRTPENIIATQIGFPYVTRAVGSGEGLLSRLWISVAGVVTTI